MSLLKTILVAWLGVMFIHFVEGRIIHGVFWQEKEDQIENAPFEVDGSAQSNSSAGRLIIPEGSGGFQGVQISKTRLAFVISSSFENISQVYNLSFEPVSSFFRDVFDFFGFIAGFTTSFSVRIRSGEVFNGIECLSYISTQIEREGSDKHENPDLILASCQSNKFFFKQRLFIPMKDIVVHPEKFERRKQLNKRRREDF